jgi:hypothetical protein
MEHQYLLDTDAGQSARRDCGALNTGTLEGQGSEGHSESYGLPVRE